MKATYTPPPVQQGTVTLELTEAEARDIVAYFGPGHGPAHQTYLDAIGSIDFTDGADAQWRVGQPLYSALYNALNTRTD